MICYCNHCNREIDPNSKICPYCGKKGKTAHETMVFSVEASVGMHVVLSNKTKGKKKYKYILKEFKYINVISHRLNKSVRRITDIDRRNNTYYEKILDEKTGEVIHLCDEPLDQHIGHGSAKFKKK